MLWRVEILRKGYRSAQIDVEATDECTARTLALDSCGDVDFGPEYDADYEASCAYGAQETSEEVKDGQRK